MLYNKGNENPIHSTLVKPICFVWFRVHLNENTENGSMFQTKPTGRWRDFKTFVKRNN